MYPIRLLAGLVHFVIGLVELLISLRIILKLFGASTTAPFVSWVYETSYPLIAPFAGMFPAPQLSGLFVLEFSAIFALVVYMFAGYFLTEAVANISASTRKKK